MPDPDSDDFLPAIRRARFGQLNIYEISDTELQLLERGSPDSLLLTFSIFFLSTALSFFITLLTNNISSDRLFYMFVIVVVIGFAAGFVLLALWRWHNKSRAEIFRTIRSRMPPEGENAILDMTDSDS